MADWSSLPADLLEAIVKRFSAIEDLVALRAVCQWWRRAVPRDRWRPCVPWLMLADNKEKMTTGFYSLEREKRYDLKLPPARRRWGSQNGWIFNVGPNLETFLFNFLTGVEIPLPSLTTFEKPPQEYEVEKCWFNDCYVQKAIVFERPKPTHAHTQREGQEEVEVIAMLIYGCDAELAFSKPGYESWVFVEHEKFRNGKLAALWDVIYSKGQIFAVGWSGSMYVWDMDGPHPSKAVMVVSKPKFVHNEGEEIYLVESGEDLLMVLRFRSAQPLRFRSEKPKIGLKTKKFKVYKFKYKRRTWKRVGNLGDRTLFVGRSYSMSVPATSLNCKGNSIYFDDCNWQAWCEIEVRGGHDMGIFDFEKKTFEPHYIGEDSLCSRSPPTWVMPSFY